MAHFENLIGKKFNRLTVLELKSKRVNKSKRTTFLCKCDCGNEKILDGSQVKCGRIKSCGCLQKEKASLFKKKPNGVSYFNKVKRNYIKHAKNRNYSFELSDEEIKVLIFGNCYYCGAEPGNEIKDFRLNPKFNSSNSLKYNGIDRINNTKNYTINNVVSCCKTCNWQKSNLSYEKFIEHIKQQYEHLSSKGLL